MQAQIFRMIRFLVVIGFVLGFSLGCSSSDSHPNAGTGTGAGGNTGGGVAVTEESLFSAPSDDLTQAENDLVASGAVEHTAALSNFPPVTP